MDKNNGIYDTAKRNATNADKLRSMSDEELAEWVAYNTSCETCPVKSTTAYECHQSNCQTAWEIWLKSPEVSND